MILKELEEPPGGHPLFARHRGVVPTYTNHYIILVPYVNDYL